MEVDEERCRRKKRRRRRNTRKITEMGKDEEE